MSSTEVTVYTVHRTPPGGMTIETLISTTDKVLAAEIWQSIDGTAFTSRIHMALCTLEDDGKYAVPVESEHRIGPLCTREEYDTFRKMCDRFGAAMVRWVSYEMDSVG